MKVSDTQRIAIIGAGLAGTLLAILLAKRGFRVDLFERNADQRKEPVPAGRSINLALAERGRHALHLAGILDQVDEFTIPMRGRMLHELQGEPVLQPYGKNDSEVIYSTHRAKLNTCLLNAADATGRIRTYFKHKLVKLDWDRRRALFVDEYDEDKTEHAHPFDILIGADGGGSAVRKAMIDGTNVGLREDILDHGYKELTIPAGPNGEFLLDKNALHIWPRGGYMLIALPNQDGSFTVTLFLPKDAEPGFQQLQTWDQQREFMHQQFPDVVPLLEDLQGDFTNNPVGLLGTIRCEHWHIGGRVLLIGDAAHAIVPFHGQGMNAAFEDCSEFINCIDDPEKSWREVFEIFERKRLDNAHAIADMALENYIIMRDSVRDPQFLLRKTLEHELERRHPNHFVARYSLVMFHRIPYAEAMQRGDIQTGILDQLIHAKADSLDDIDFVTAEQLINKHLQPLPANQP